MDQANPRRETTILDYWRIILQRRWIIAGLVVSTVVVTGVLSVFFVPKLYEAKAAVFPAKQDTGGGGITFGGTEKDKSSGGLGGAIMMEALGGPKAGPSVMDTLYAILLSRTMAERVISQLNLKEYYGETSLDKTIQALRWEADVRISKQKMIEITVLTRDPRMAADIANTYVSNLDGLNKELNITASKRSRLFLEGRLAEKAKHLAAAEDALKAFQTVNLTLGVPEQASAAMGAAALIHGQIVQYEVELAALREYATPFHPLINQLQVQIAELRRELGKLEQREMAGIGVGRSSHSASSTKVLPSFEEAPALARDLLRLTRQVKVEEAVYGMLIGMLEQVKIAEVRDLPTIQVLDSAVPPERKSRPKVLFNLLIAGAVSLVLGLLLVFFFNYLETLKAQEVAAVSLIQGAGSPATGYINGNGDRIEGLPVPTKEMERLQS